MANKLSFLTENYKTYIKGKNLLIIVFVGFFFIMSLYITTDDQESVSRKNKIDVNLDETFSDNDNTIKIALEERIKDLEERDKKNSKLIEDIASGKVPIASLGIIEEEIESLRDDIGYQEEYLNNEIKEAKEASQNIIYKFQNKPLTEIEKPSKKPLHEPKFTGDNFYQNVNQSYLSHDQEIKEGEYDAIENNEIDMVVFGNHTDFDVNEYLPAGSIASAKLLSSVDAGVGVTSQTEPRPVLMRVTSFAYSSANKEDLNLKNKTDIRGCTLTGEASGDLSSERGYIRLIRMTCNSQDQKVTETDVFGYVSSFGKAGIRGRVIEKEGDLVVKSFISGIMANLGKSIEQKYQADTTINGAVATIGRSSSQIAKSGVGSGFGSALDRLSDYYIKKMEQIEPVISIGQGLDVEVIFYKGSFIDGRGPEKKKLSKI